MPSASTRKALLAIAAAANLVVTAVIGVAGGVGFGFRLHVHFHARGWCWVAGAQRLERSLGQPRDSEERRIVGAANGVDGAKGAQQGDAGCRPNAYNFVELGAKPTDFAKPLAGAV